MSRRKRSRGCGALAAAVRSVAALAIAAGAAGTAGCVDDPPTYSDYDRLSDKADECGPMHVTVRGIVDDMVAPRLFRLTDPALFADGVWVLSNSGVRVDPDEYVIAHGTLQPGPPEALEPRHAVAFPPRIRDQIAREGLFVAESMAAFPGGPPD